MNTFASAVKNTPQYTNTENGAITLSTSNNECVDLFFYIGASREAVRSNTHTFLARFERAFQENAELATKIMLWVRDIREGAGEREVFRTLLKYLEENHPDMLERIMWKIPEMGRWDDLLVFNTKKFKERAYEIIWSGINNPDTCGLVAKWMPRKGQIANELRKAFAAQENKDNWTPKEYRKYLVARTSVIESSMCAKDWNSIDFNKVPSLAMARYTAAFYKNAKDSFETYKSNLKKGVAKINTAAIYPYDVIKTMTRGDKDLAVLQWDALKNFLGDNKIIPMVDVSGSMTAPVSASNATLSCMDVAVSLGLYVADKQSGVFKNMFLTFSERSTIEILKGNIWEKYRQMIKSHWGMNTNLNNAFAEILRVAITNKITEEEMPKILLILSDMEFDRCGGKTNFKNAESMFEEHGYKLPKIIFWNIQSRSLNNVPVKSNQSGVALVSGFSSAIFETLLKGEIVSPEQIMNETIQKERYNF